MRPEDAHEPAERASVLPSPEASGEGSGVRARPDYPIIDADVHIHEDPQELAEFAEGTLRRGLEAHRAPERWLDTPGYSPLTPFDPPLGDDPRRQQHVVRTREQLRADLDSLGIDAAVVFTGRLLGTAVRQDASYPVAIAQTYNRYLCERWLAPEQGIYGAIMVAAQDPRSSAREIERYAAVEGVAAVYLPAAGVYPLWGHRQYDPIYAAAEAAGLPVVLHSYTFLHPVFPHQLYQYDTALAKQTLGKPLCAIANLVSIATTGVLARFPRLKVVFAECGVSWLPFVMWRLDEQYRWLRHEVPCYQDRPSVYIRRQVYVTTQRLDEPDGPQALAALVEGAGLVDRLLFSTDWPHYDADRVDRAARLLPAAWARKVFYENPCAAFKLPRLARRAPAPPSGQP